MNGYPDFKNTIIGLDGTPARTHAEQDVKAIPEPVGGFVYSMKLDIDTDFLKHI